MITVISNVHTGNLVLPGLLAVGLFWLGYLGKVFIDEWRDHMHRNSRPELLDEYADHDRASDMTAVMDGLQDYPDLDEDRVTDEDTGRHSLAAVPAPSEMELTGYLPVSSGDGAA